MKFIHAPARTAFLAAALSLLLTPGLLGGTVTGHVRDSGQAHVAGARVVIERGTTSVAESVTDNQGRFQFDEVSSGSYLLRVFPREYASSGVARVIQVREEALAVDVAIPVMEDEITVIGSRIAAAPETIPGSVTVLGRDTIDATNPTNLTELLRKVPGINVRDEEGMSLRPNIGIRGMNPTRSTKVLLLEDGLPLTYAPYGDNASYYHPPMERFESIEILKGSGQVAYGPVTVGGVINYLTPMPPANQETRLKLTAGNRDYLNAHLSWGATFGKTGILVDVTRKQGDGVRENLHSELNDVNAKIVHSFSEDQSLTLRTNYYGEDSNVTYSGLRTSEYEADPRQNPFLNDFFYGDRFGLGLVHRVRFADNLHLSTSLYGSKFKRHWWRQSSNSGQRPNDSADALCGGMDNLSTTCGNEGRLRQYLTFGVEPRLHWNGTLLGIANDIQVGLRAHFEDQERIQKNGDTSTARDGRIVENNSRDNQALSMFIQDRMTFGKLTVSPGLRIENIEYERRNRLANGGAGASGETSLTQLVPGLGVSYEVGQSTFFGGIHRGFAPPRTEDIVSDAGGVIDLDPELSWNSELGARLAPWPGVQFEATLFRMDYENQIVPASVAGGVGATLTNAGETLHQGLELGGRFDTAAALGTSHNAYTTLSYTFVRDAEFAGERFSGVSGFSNVSITGNRLPYAPEHLLTAGVGYLLTMGLEVFVEGVHVSEQFGDDLNTVASTADGQRGLLPSYTTWNATVNYELRALRTTLFASVKNATDELYIADRTRGIIPGAPRLYQVGVSFRR